MSKAYDSVNLDLFTKALYRIQMPSQLIQILTDLLTNRSKIKEKQLPHSFGTFIIILLFTKYLHPIQDIQPQLPGHLIYYNLTHIKCKFQYQS